MPSHLSANRALSSVLCIATFVLPLIAMTGCSQPKGGSLNLPPWALNPPATCALGTVKYRGNLGLAKSGAIARGRDALARQLETKVEGLIKDYQSQGETEEQGFTEELITQVSKQSVRQSLEGTRLKEWQLNEGDNPTLHTLVCLEPEALIEAFGRMSQLSKKQRAGLRDRAKKAFAELEQQ